MMRGKEDQEEELQEEEDENNHGELLVEAGCVINCVKQMIGGKYRIYYATMNYNGKTHPLFVGFKHGVFNSMEYVIADNYLTDDYIQLIKEIQINIFARHIGSVGENTKKKQKLIFYWYNYHCSSQSTNFW